MSPKTEKCYSNGIERLEFFSKYHFYHPHDYRGVAVNDGARKCVGFSVLLGDVSLPI
jgi:hypothetical protein